MVKVVLLRGLPGSGKTTRALTEYEGWYRVNRDTIRQMLYGKDYKYSRAKEDIVRVTRNALIVDAVKLGRHVVVDDTNLSTKPMEQIMQALNGLEVEFSYDDTCLEVPLIECIKRDAARSEGHVGRDVIERMWRQHLQTVRLPQEGLPPCLIVDVDGTLADKGNRHPYDWGKVINDEPKQHVIDLVNRYADTHRIIVFSGRDGQCYGDTEQWLVDNGVRYDELYLRTTKDSRKDTVIKYELYEQYVHGFYNVEFVLDDRDSVVCMWRSMGIPVMQVAYGSF